MNPATHLIKSYPLRILLLSAVIGLTGCATPVSQKADDIDKTELAMRLQNCISFISAAGEQAKSSGDNEAQEITDKAQHLSLDAKEDFTHERYKDALNKINEAYLLGLKALAILKQDLPPSDEEQKHQLQHEAEARLQVNEAYINAVKRTFGYVTTDAALTAFEVAKKEREKALNKYNAERYQEAISTADKSTDNLILILTELEYIEHDKAKKKLNVEQLIDAGEKEQQQLQSIQLQ